MSKSYSEKWILPTGIEEALPKQAKKLEYLRQKILRLFDCWGYDLVIPSMLEYLESLLVMGDEELDRRTLKVVDQLNGRMMGLRPDITPQVARIDAHRMDKQSSNRLCYVGTVLHAQAIDVVGTRATIQYGAEIYGDASIESDVEIILLMLESLRLAGVAGRNLQNLHLDVGHIGIYSALVAQAGLHAEQSKQLFQLIQMKSMHEIREYLTSIKAKAEDIQKFTHLVQLHGGDEVIDKAWEVLPDEAVRQVIRKVKKLSQRLRSLGLGLGLNYDFADLAGFQYETGIVFTVFQKNMRCPIARGGRYDDIGEVFGSARPATGFSSDLRLLASMVPTQRMPQRKAIFAPISKDPDLHETIQSLRKQGKRVVQQLHRKETAQVLECTHELVLDNRRWQTKAV